MIQFKAIKMVAIRSQDTIFKEVPAVLLAGIHQSSQPFCDAYLDAALNLIRGKAIVVCTLRSNV